MNVAGLCHPLRHDFYVSHPPALIYCLDDCTCWPYGDPRRATRTIGQQRYCWIVWKHGHLGPTVLRWATFRQPQTLRIVECPRCISTESGMSV